MDLIQNNEFLKNVYFLFLKDFFKWKGRTLRVQYIARFFIMFLLLFYAMYNISMPINPNESWFSIIINCFIAIFLLLSVFQTFPLTVRRLHDLNLSGWWLLATFLPLMGQVSLIVLSILKGNSGPNKYGPPPSKD